MSNKRMFGRLEVHDINKGCFEVDGDFKEINFNSDEMLYFKSNTKDVIINMQNVICLIKHYKVV